MCACTWFKEKKENTGVAAAAASETTAWDEKQKGRLVFVAAAIVTGHAVTFGLRQSSSTWLPNQMRSNLARSDVFVWLAARDGNDPQPSQWQKKNKKIM